MRKDLVLVSLLVTILALMAVPINQRLVDVLLAVNISLSIVLLMVAIYIKRPSDFATFPSVILIGTAFRLALSIATTRLILSEADAGTIIETFGNFVVAGSVGIGLVIFLIITVVQFLVITKGAERVAEVGARFALDAMPGKQMSIDAEARAENIDAEEARRQRALLDKDSQFFGAMDGAMKFVKGDAIAGLIIICINLIGGVTVGMSLHGFSFGESISVFSLLTIGDGLVAQFPALLMSLCAGVMVTRVTKGDAQDLGTDIIREIVSDARVPAVGSLVVFGVGLVPGFPTFVFSAISAGMLFSAAMMRRRMLAEARAAAEEEAPEVEDEAEEEDGMSLPESARFVVGIGSDLLETLDIDRIRSLIADRHWRLYAQRGVRFPRAALRLGDDQADASEITVFLDEVPLLRVAIPVGRRLVRRADLETITQQLGEVEAQELEAKLLSGAWIDASLAPKLEEIGVVSSDPEDVIASLAFRLYEHNLGQLFSNAVLGTLLDSFRAADAEMIEQIEEDMKQPALLKTFRYLVEDGVPLRPADLVISSLHFWINNSDEPTSVMMAEGLRSAMKRQLCHAIAGRAGVLGLALVDPAMENEMRQSLSDMSDLPSDPTFDGIFLEPDIHEAVLEQFKTLEQTADGGDYQLTIIASADIRRRLRNYLAMNDLHLPVLAPHEIAGGIPSLPLQVIGLDRTIKPKSTQPALER